MRNAATRREAHPIERQWRDVRGFRTVARREESRRAVALLAVASSLVNVNLELLTFVNLKLHTFGECNPK